MSWDGDWQQLLPMLGSLPELIALVCLFVLNNALWMRLLFQWQDQGSRALWEGVRQLTLLTQEVSQIREWLVFQTEMLEAGQEAVEYEDKL